MGRSVKRGERGHQFCVQGCELKGGHRAEEGQLEADRGEEERRRSNLEVVVAWSRHVHVYIQISQYNDVSKSQRNGTDCLYPKALSPSPAIPLLNVLCSTSTQAQKADGSDITRLCVPWCGR